VQVPFHWGVPSQAIAAVLAVDAMWAGCPWGCYAMSRMACFSVFATPSVVLDDMVPLFISRAMEKKERALFAHNALSGRYG